jgi:hypothetical protein
MQWITFFLAISLSFSATGAEIDLTKVGAKLEGDISPGDLDKIAIFLKINGPVATSPISLASKGGDVEEAMKIGRLFRRLKITVWIPTFLKGYPPSCGPKLVPDRIVKTPYKSTG